MGEYGQVHPRDAHNRTLVDNVHPPDWSNPAPADRYNLVVVGAGTAGLVTAMGAAKLGAKVALVERHLMGGDCLNVGCVPSKALIRSARVAADVRNAARFGVKVPEGVAVDFPAVMERMRRLRSDISEHDAVQRFAEAGVDVFFGDAAFNGARSLQVAGATLLFKKAVIATGARARIPDIDGLADIEYLTNETIFELTELPARLGVIGAGPLGCELAQAFQRFGSRVTLFERADQMLPREDRDAADILYNAMQRDGVEFVFKSTVARVEEVDGEKRLTVTVDGKEREVTVDAVLIGAGRRPNVEHLGLEAAGVAYDARHGVTVDDSLRTTNKHIFAAGDCCSKYKFTHVADFAARLVLRNALFLGRSKFSALTIPWCTYTDPEIAHVGLYEGQARERGMEVDTYTRPLAEVDRAVTDGETEGFVRIHCRAGSDAILGATIVAREAGNMINELTAAIAHGLGLGKITNVIHPYPTQGEAIRQAGDIYTRTRLTPFVEKLFKLWLKWQR